MTKKTDMIEGQDEVLASSSSEDDKSYLSGNMVDSDGEEGYDD